LTKPVVQIRKATALDAEVILTFIKALAEYEKLSHEVIASAEKLRETLFGSSPYAEVLILEENGLPAAFALFFHNYSTFLAKPGIYLEDLYVHVEHRGKGFGKNLLLYLAELAVDRQCGRLEWSVLDWNSPALDFYKSLGAVPQSEWTVQRVTGPTLEHLARLSRDGDITIVK
jgi:GNAT superfamily N-acetyltransferase